MIKFFKVEIRQGYLERKNWQIWQEVINWMWQMKNQEEVTLMIK